MKAWRWLPLAALAVAGCGGLKSTLPDRAAPVSFVGVAGPTIAAANVEPELSRVQKELEQRLIDETWPVPVRLSRIAEDALRIRLGADESFDPAGADLAPEALVVYAAIADACKAAPAMVAHVVVHGDAPAEELPTDLSARRAAAVQSYLVVRGVPATRVRAEGRANAEALTKEVSAGAVNRRVEIVLKPVIEGREAMAWMPPVATCEGCIP